MAKHGAADKETVLYDPRFKARQQDGKIDNAVGMDDSMDMDTNRHNQSAKQISTFQLKSQARAQEMPELQDNADKPGASPSLHQENQALQPTAQEEEDGAAAQKDSD